MEEAEETIDASSPSTRLSFWGGLLAAVALFVAARAFGLSAAEQATAAVAGLCAVWWIAQPVSIPVTSLIPFCLFPFFGVTDHKAIAHSYGHYLILLLMAGLMLSAAIEACGAHRRLALGMARVVSGGGDVTPRRLLLGFMIAAAFGSMWISNTATTLILLPIALAATDAVEAQALRPKLLLGVAYAASIGGIGTPIGTPPNLVFMGAYEELGLPAWSFLDWMKVGVPVVVLMIPAAFLLLSMNLPRVTIPPLTGLGKATKREQRVIFIFALTAVAWITRGTDQWGWAAALGLQKMVGDSTVAFAGLLAMFLIPDGAGRRLLSWDEAKKIPWGILLLFAGGMALAAGFKSSGLSTTLGKGLSILAEAPELVMIFGTCIAVTFLTEVTSNTATTALLMPILGAAAEAAGIPPAKLMVPAALSASCAFMLPVATAPNAIMFSSGHVSMKFMARQGILLNLMGTIVVTTICSFLL